MTPSQLAALRATFEAEFLKRGFDMRMMTDWRYTDDMTEGAWRGYQAAQPSLLELRDKLVGEMQVAQHTEILHGSGAQISVALHEAISIITSGFAPYVKGE